MFEHGEGGRSGAGEQLLVARAQRGDQGAFEALVVKYQVRIYRVIQRFLGGSDMVEDLAQEVFIRAYRSLPSFKGESSLYTWLYKIALNLCRNHYRTRARRPESEPLGEEGAAQPVAADDTPEETVFRREFWERLRGALDELPAEQREAVILCDLEGMSYEDMAAVIDVPIGTVRSRIFRGRKALQEKLAEFAAAPRVAVRAGG